MATEWSQSPRLPNMRDQRHGKTHFPGEGGGCRGAACENRTRDLLITSEPFLALASNNATKDDSKRPDQRSNTANEKRLALRAVCILCVLARYFDGVPIMGIVASGHRYPKRPGLWAETKPWNELLSPGSFQGIFPLTKRSSDTEGLPQRGPCGRAGSVCGWCAAAWSAAIDDRLWSGCLVWSRGSGWVDYSAGWISLSVTHLWLIMVISPVSMSTM